MKPSFGPRGARSLAPWTILDVLRSAGIDVPDPEGRQKITIACPLPQHHDTHPSAYVTETNVFGCSVCTSGEGWPTRRLAGELGVSWGTPRHGYSSQRSALRPIATRVPSRPPRTTVSQAAHIWDLALARTLDDDAAEKDRDAYRYLSGRGIAASWNERVFGILASDMPLPEVVAWFPARSYRLVAPLYSQNGEVRSLQARAIADGVTPTKMSLPDLPIRELIFANRFGVELLRGAWNGPPVVLLGEGITDHWALSSVCTLPVFCIPGASLASFAFGPWASGMRILLAVDRDEMGDEATQRAQTAAFHAGASRMRRLRLPENCKDVCDCVRLHGLEELIQRTDRAVEEILR